MTKLEFARPSSFHIKIYGPEESFSEFRGLCARPFLAFRPASRGPTLSTQAPMLIELRRYN